MKENQIGALWNSRTENPKAPFAKGSITVGGEKISIVIWKNKWKEPGEATPDYYIERDMPRQGGKDGQGSTQGAQGVKLPQAQQAGAVAQGSQSFGGAGEGAQPFDDDIPF